MALIVLIAMSESHYRWGNPFLGDGQKAMGVAIKFAFIGMSAASVFFAIGTVLQSRFHNRPAVFVVAADLLLFVAFTGTLTYLGIAADPI